ncbi:nuclear transport factor 2 family protein [Hyphococcus sp.]|uniref:nuclear transport factor 2 family protein n=1 Tax=Hyphococcus sp. TaxID=2038636 RepID=UPI0035C72A0E
MRTFILLGAAALALGACKTTSNMAEDSQAALEEANKEKALYCMDLLFNQHDIETAREECFGETYIQHNPMAPDGPDALFAFMEPFFEANPDAAIHIKRVAAEGDLVWIHYNNKPTPDSLGLAVVDILRMEDGKFVEHWDVVQPVPEKSANDNTMF